MRYWAFYYLWFAFRFRPETGHRARILAGYPGSVSPELQDVNKMAAIVTIMSLAEKPFWTHSVGQAPSALPACCSAETMLGLN